MQAPLRWMIRGLGGRRYDKMSRCFTEGAQKALCQLMQPPGGGPVCSTRGGGDRVQEHLVMGGTGIISDGDKRALGYGMAPRRT